MPLRELTIEMLFSSLKKLDFEEFERIFYYMFRNLYRIKIGRKWLVGHPWGYLNAKESHFSINFNFYRFLGKKLRDFKHPSFFGFEML